ncbi:MAG: SUMF1/EgtB/PvdO family nonheme iron enzyme [bacterium]|nr:SUMF1/EgtB/PvdO family nonheme iron enzyme [bacterium]
MGSHPLGTSALAARRTWPLGGLHRPNRPGSSAIFLNRPPVCPAKIPKNRPRFGRESHPRPKPDRLLGFQDLGGNVMEWCNDYVELLSSEAPVTDPMGPSRTDYRALRNGHWYSFSNAHMRGSWRAQSSPTHGYDNAGFRVCRTVQ